MAPICIVDYGVGNIHSAMKALKRYAPDVILSEDPEQIAAAPALVLPGQGAFASGMDGLRVRGLIETVRSAGMTGKPILGICLGAQLLLEKGFEFGAWEGLGLIPGTVEHFPVLAEAKTPHMGWNAIAPSRHQAWAGTALSSIPSGAEMYFIHSYVMKPGKPEDILAETEYGGIRFASAVGRGHIVGCQFHPEKSGEMGMRIIENFTKMVQNT